MKRNEFINAYAERALWSSTDENGDPLDEIASPDDIAPETMREMRSDCADFIWSNRADLRAYRAAGYNFISAGHDFWLTRNGHGAGFWDRGLGDLGERLSNAAEIYVGVDLYVGDDGMVYS